MRIAKKDVPVKIEAPGAIARLRTEFGSAQGYTNISAEYFSLGAGTDIAPLLKGLEGDACQAPHWGYLAEGALTVTYNDGKQGRGQGRRPVLLAARPQRARRAGRRGDHVQPATRAPAGAEPHESEDGRLTPGPWSAAANMRRRRRSGADCRFRGKNDADIQKIAREALAGSDKFLIGGFEFQYASGKSSAAPPNDRVCAAG